jgi:hypothetical protein
MNTGVITIRSKSNSLFPQDTVKTFHWDLDKYSHSNDALNHIELLMMSQQAFSVTTSMSLEHSKQREAIVNNGFKRLSVQFEKQSERVNE